MRDAGKLVPAAITVAMLAFVGVTALPNYSHAAFEACNLKCKASRCSPPTDPKKHPLCKNITCTDHTNTGITTCTCENSEPGVCVADGFNTPGGDMKGMTELMKFIQDIFGKLMQKQGGGGGSAGAPGATGEERYPSCQINPATNTVSPIPCRMPDGSVNYTGTTATNVANTGSGVNLLDLINSGGTNAGGVNVLDLINSGGTGNTNTGSGTNLLDIINNPGGTNTNTNTNTNTGSNSVTGTNSGTGGSQTNVSVTGSSNTGKGSSNTSVSVGTLSGRGREDETPPLTETHMSALTNALQDMGGVSVLSNVTQQVVLELVARLQAEGLTQAEALQIVEALFQGDIAFDGSGAAIYTRARDPNSNSEVVGFYGGSAGGPLQSRSLLGRLCSSRPWAGGFVSALVSPSFFDGLCQRVGYQVGEVTLTSGGNTYGKAPQRPQQKTIIVTQPSTQAVIETPTIQPFVDIWASPQNVRLGSRTYIFWNTRDVVSCKETGPSFEQFTLSGGAATVPITNPVTFVIECTAEDGRVIRDSVTLNIAI